MQNLFESISSRNKEKLLKLLRSQTVTYPKGVNILSNVNRGNFIGIIDVGSLLIEFNDYKGNSIIIDELFQNDIFGNLISSINFEGVSCITKEKTVITYIDYDNITKSEITRSEFYITFVQNLIKLMVTQMNTKNERIEILTRRTIRDKLLRYFKMLSTKRGSKTFNIPYSYIDLANYLSVDRSAMTRELKNLKTEGFIQINGKRVKLLY